MDLLIKNMHMPTDDVLRIEIYPNGQVYRIIGWAISEKRDSTAIEVPPHGRLVDADANREDFMDTVYSELHSDGDNYRANRIIDAYDNAPTILEASK